MQAEPLPQEILLHIFECAVGFIPGYLNVNALQRSYERNATLRMCALVCKDWAAAAQDVLFRDISLGVTTLTENDPSNVHAGRGGTTAPALQSLIATLETFRAVPRRVRALHLGIGTGDTQFCDRTRRLQWIRHGPASQVIRAVTLCPDLVHLCVAIGVKPEDDDDEMSFSSRTLAPLKTASLPNLQQLSVRANETDLFAASVWKTTMYPNTLSVNALIASLADRLTFLQVNTLLPEDEDMPDHSLIPPLPPLPRLETFFGNGLRHDRTALATNAPLLHRGDYRDIDFLPPTVRWDMLWFVWPGRRVLGLARRMVGQGHSLIGY